MRWARNLVSTAGEARDNIVVIHRDINGARGCVMLVNDTSEAGLVTAVRQAEVVALRRPETGSTAELVTRHAPEPVERPAVFSESTYQLDAAARATAAQRLAQLAAERGLLSAGYAAVAAHSNALFDTLGRSRYAQYTQARYAVTVRDPSGTGSGWAGDSHWNWAKLDPERLTQVAIEKCVKSQNPVRIEPGRYTAILESQAVADFIGPLVYHGGNIGAVDTYLGRVVNHYRSNAGIGPFADNQVRVRWGEKVIDERLTLSTDPMDPELGYPPFNLWQAAVIPSNGLYFDINAFHPATWIKDGVLQALAYDREFAIKEFAQSTALPNPGGFRMSVTGPTATVDEMIASTKRGLLVTRFDQVELLDLHSMLTRGYTRDGLWLVEDGKISKPVKNLQFTDGIMAKLNSIEQLGAPDHAFHPPGSGPLAFPEPVIVPAMKLTDFSFTSLSDAV